MTTSALEPLLSIRQLAAELKLSIDQVYRLTRHPDPQKRLPHRLIGGHQRAGALRFLPSEVKAWQDRQPGFKLPAAPEPVKAVSAIGRRSRFRE